MEVGRLMVNNWEVFEEGGRTELDYLLVVHSGKPYRGTQHNPSGLKWWTFEFTDSELFSKHVQCILKRLKTTCTLEKNAKSFNLTDCCFCFRVRIGGIGGISDWGPDRNIRCYSTVTMWGGGNSAHRQESQSGGCATSVNIPRPTILLLRNTSTFVPLNPNPPFSCSEANFICTLY